MPDFSFLSLVVKLYLFKSDFLGKELLFIILWPLWKTDFGCCFSENTDTSFNSEPEEVTIPQKVRDIADKAFQRCSKPFHVFLLSPLRYIGRDCSTLQQLFISRRICYYGKRQATENTTIICFLLSSYKERDVSPREWLNDVIGKFPYYLAPKSDRDLKELLPDVWRK